MVILGLTIFSMAEVGALSLIEAEVDRMFFLTSTIPCVVGQLSAGEGQA